MKLTRVFSIFLLFVSSLSTSLAVQAESVDFELPGMDGNQYKLSDYRGKWVLVNFWATWCPPCLEEMPELELFHLAHKDTDAVVLGVNQEDVSDKKLAQFVEDSFVSYPILKMKPNDRTSLGRVTALPTSFLISPEGDVSAKQVGTVTAASIEKFINQKQQQKLEENKK